MKKIFALLLFAAFTVSGALACFGTEFKVGIPTSGKEMITASYALGYYVEEKTGIVPYFFTTEDIKAALKEEDVDIWLAKKDAELPPKVLVVEAGEIPGLGEVVFWLRDDIPEDIRFTTVERALGLMGQFYRSKTFKSALGSDASFKKAARKAVLNAD